MPNPNLPINAQYNTYIGARYVPKFATPYEWSATSTYEPLTIVMYQGNSYTSRTFVPLGVPPTNETYWAQTGNYNAQIEQYRKDVQAVEEEIEKVRIEIMDYNEYEMIKNKKVIFIGDSYGSAWYANIKKVLPFVEGESCWIAEDGGAGFLKKSVNRNQTFLEELQWLLPSIPDPELVTDIYVIGGANDINYTSDQQINAILAFSRYANATFPNAITSIGFVGMFKNWNDRQQIIRAIGNYSKCGGFSPRLRYMTNLEYTLANYSLLQDDGLHPIAIASQYIANNIVNYMLGKSIDNVSGTWEHNLDMIQTGSTGTLRVWCSNNLKTITIPSESGSCNIEAGSSPLLTFLIGRLPTASAIWGNQTGITGYMAYQVMDNEAFVITPVVYSVSNGQIEARIIKPSSNIRYITRLECTFTMNALVI